MSSRELWNPLFDPGDSAARCLLIDAEPRAAAQTAASLQNVVRPSNIILAREGRGNNFAFGLQQCMSESNQGRGYPIPLLLHVRHKDEKTGHIFS